MKTFPDDAFIPEPGRLAQLIYENPDRGISPRLEFSVEIPFEDFELEGEEISTSLWLSGIQLPAKSWQELSSADADPAALARIDGSLRLFGAMNPVELTALKFSEIAASSIEVRLAIEVDFEAEGDDDYGIVPLELEAALAIGELKIATSIEKRLKGDAAAIAEAISDRVDLSVYGELEKVPGGVSYPLRA